MVAPVNHQRTLCIAALVAGTTGLVSTGLVACGDSSSSGLTGEDPDAETGPAWMTQATVPTQVLLSVWGRASDEIWAVGWDGTIAYYDGVEWQLETTTATVPLTGVSGVPLPGNLAPEDPRPDPTVFAVGWNGTILARQPGGVWVPATITGTMTENLSGIAVARDDRALAVGDNGRIVRWDGTAWTPADLRVRGAISLQLIRQTQNLQRVWTGNGNRFYMIGSGGAAYRSSNGLESFETIETGNNETLHGVWGASNNNVYSVGVSGLIMRFTDQWRRVTNNQAADLPAVVLYAVSGLGGGDISIVGEGGTAVRFSDGSWAVESTDTDVDLRDIWVDTSTDTAYAVGASGTILIRDESPPLEGPN